MISPAENNRVMKKILVLQVAALGAELLRKNGVAALAGLPVHPLQPVFPAVTCTAQATLRTGLLPQEHGMPANGIYLRETFQTLFWCQSANLVKGTRIWEDFRARGGRVGIYFFQQSLGEDADEIVSPAPIHKHDGGMIMATYQKPAGLLKRANPVPLYRYWGPLASRHAGDRIVQTLCDHLQTGTAPELIFAYLPTLDYDLQRFGVSHPKARKALQHALGQIDDLVSAARARGYDVVIAGDYAITDVTHGPVFPNRILKEKGLFAVRRIAGRDYPDFYQSRAFALCDHQVAHVYCQDPGAIPDVQAAFAAADGIETVRPCAGDADLELVAAPGTWFAYPWWEEASQAPDYADHVDIHNKPGFDPCELFFGRNPFRCGTDSGRVRGTHGRDDAPVAYASTLPGIPGSFRAVADLIGESL